MGRIPYGIEIDPQRYDWIKARIQHKENLFLGDTRNLTAFDFPPFDFSVTSPPYMPSGDAWNPLRNGDPAFSGYDQYLCDLQAIYKHVRTLMKKDAYIVVQVDNMTHSGYFSPQVWDVGRALSFIMPLEGEIIFHGDRLPNGTTPFMQCLVFKT